MTEEEAQRQAFLQELDAELRALPGDEYEQGLKGLVAKRVKEIEESGVLKSGTDQEGDEGQQAGAPEGAQEGHDRTT